MNKNAPKVSIGLPVFNGENYLREALDSLLSQSYTDFELIIADNASTDSTQDICKSYAQSDNRIHYYRNETNIGAAENYNKVLEYAHGTYFKWAAHDDVCSKDFLHECVNKLDEDKSVILCYSKEKAINEEGDPIDGYMNKYQKLRFYSSKEPSERFRELSCAKHGCYQVFGLMRVSTLRLTGLMGTYIGADRVLLSELSMRGKFWESTSPIYYRRHPSQYCALKSEEARVAWYSSNTKKVVGTNIMARQFKEYIHSIKRANLSLSETIKCYGVMLLWLLKKRKRLKGEIISFIKKWANIEPASSEQVLNKNRG